jgi:hypothetical protein
VERGQAQEDLQDPGSTLKKYRAVYAAGRGIAWHDAATFNAQRGIDTETVESWARNNLGHSSGFRHPVPSPASGLGRVPLQASTQ